jgi:hypothetical protein
MSWWQRTLHRPFFIRLLHWEYWSFHTVYFCVYPVWLYLCARSRSFFFFSAANPQMENGGFLMESKKKIYESLPDMYYPKTILVRSEDPIDKICKAITDNGLGYPLIVKPDIGGRGRGVMKVSSESELLTHLKKFPVDMLIQQFIPYEDEIGIFYFRYPGQAQGNISGIVGKQFLKVIGDGRSTIEQLLSKEKRYILQMSILEQMLGKQIKTVLAEGEERILVPYGNHARGALFNDCTHLADESLTNVIDSICKQIPGFYFGRLDVRFQSLEKLKEGKEFSLIEVNGAGSEPTHIYDPSHSLWQAWKEIIKHWFILWRISKLNHANGANYLNWKQGVSMFRRAREYDKMIDGIG